MRHGLGACCDPVSIAPVAGKRSQRAGCGQLLQIALSQTGAPREVADIFERVLPARSNDAFGTILRQTFNRQESKPNGRRRAV
jgi:hypothetical protein